MINKFLKVHGVLPLGFVYRLRASFHALLYSVHRRFGVQAAFRSALMHLSLKLKKLHKIFFLKEISGLPAFSSCATYRGYQRVKSLHAQLVDAVD